MSASLSRRCEWLRVVLQDSTIDVYGKAVAAALFDHMDHECGCFPSTHTLARESSTTRDTVIDRIKILQAKGYVAKPPSTKGGRRPGGTGAVNQYVGTFPTGPQLSTPSTLPRPAELSTPSTLRTVDPVDTSAGQLSTPAVPTVDPSRSNCRPGRHEVAIEGSQGERALLELQDVVDELLARKRADKPRVPINRLRADFDAGGSDAWKPAEVLSRTARGVPLGQALDDVHRARRPGDLPPPPRRTEPTQNERTREHVRELARSCDPGSIDELAEILDALRAHDPDEYEQCFQIVADVQGRAA